MTKRIEASVTQDKVLRSANQKSPLKNPALGDKMTMPGPGASAFSLFEFTHLAQLTPQYAKTPSIVAAQTQGHSSASVRGLHETTQAMSLTWTVACHEYPPTSGQIMQGKRHAKTAQRGLSSALLNPGLISGGNVLFNIPMQRSPVALLVSSPPANELVPSPSQATPQA
jgi:hypothetical protein